MLIAPFIHLAFGSANFSISAGANKKFLGLMKYKVYGRITHAIKAHLQYWQSFACSINPKQKHVREQIELMKSLLVHFKEYAEQLTGY